MSEFSILGLAHKFFLAAEKQGWTPAMINELAENEIRLKDFFNVQSGNFEVRPIERAWTEQDGLVRFSVTSDGTTGPEWIKRPKKNFRVGDYAKQLLKSSDFRPTNGVTTEVVVLKGQLFSDEDRVALKIRAYAETLTFEGRRLVKPNPEIACLIREKFSDKDLEVMGLAWIVAMHEPIKDSDGGPRLLYAGRDDVGGWLGASWDGGPGSRWLGDGGFAFALPQS